MSEGKQAMHWWGLWAAYVFALAVAMRTCAMLSTHDGPGLGFVLLLVLGLPFGAASFWDGRPNPKLGVHLGTGIPLACGLLYCVVTGVSWVVVRLIGLVS